MTKRVLVVLAVGVLAMSAPALAQWDYDLLGGFAGLTISEAAAQGAAPLLLTESLEAATMMGLMRNEQDYIFEPAELGALQGWQRERSIGNKWDPNAKDEGGWFLMTNLGNMANQDAFQIGTWGQLGPGNLAVVAAFSRYKSEYYPYSDSAGDETFRLGQDLDGDGITDVVNFMDQAAWLENRKYERKDWDLYLAYGWRLGDSSSLGFSFRHIQNDYEPEDEYDSSLATYTDYSYDGSGNLSQTYVESWNALRTVKTTMDRTSDALAAEFKMWSNDYSFKVRGEYAQIEADLKNETLEGASSFWWNMGGVTQPYAYCSFGVSNPSPWACTYSQNWYDADGALLQSINESDAGNSLTDLSIDGNQWALSGRFDWYMAGGSALQFDLGYGQGDYDMKSSTPLVRSDVATYDNSIDFGDPYGFLSFYNYTDDQRVRATEGNHDISTTNWFVAGEYFWMWDKADLAVGLRYNEWKSETTVSGPFAMTFNSVANFWNFDDPPTYDVSAYMEEATGGWELSGDFKSQYLYLPVAAQLHLTDKLAVRFGAMAVFYQNTLEAKDYAFLDHYMFEESEDGTVVDAGTDDITTNVMNLYYKDNYDDTYTVYRLGLEYKFNEKVIVDLMATEYVGYSSNESGRTETGLDKIVAGLSLRF